MSSPIIEEVRERFYTFGEAAQALGVSKMTLWRWVKAGRVQTERLGREVLIERAVVDAMR